MNTEAHITRIRELIAKNKLSAAFEELARLHQGSPEEDEVLLLAAQYDENSRKSRLGLLSSADESVAQNNIRASMLALLRPSGEASRGARKTGRDPIGRDKIERQINIGQGNYIENQTIHSANQGSLSSPDQPSPDEVRTILFAAANPTNTGRIQIDKEHNIIENEMRSGSQRENFLFLPPKFAVRITDLIRALKAKPHILHFAGHGEQEGILLSNDQNQAIMLEDTAIKRLFKPLQHHTQLVLLNNCYSAHQAELISTFGMYVIGHRMPVSDAAALSFAKGFYLGLGEGIGFEEAYNDAETIVWAENPQANVTIEVWKDGKKLAW